MTIDKTVRNRRYWTKKGKEVTATGRVTTTDNERYLECVDEETRFTSWYKFSELRPLGPAAKVSPFNQLVDLWAHV